MQTTIDDPELVDTLGVDDRGRVTIGHEYANADVKIVVAEVDNGE
jgi:hypothetical protein